MKSKRGPIGVEFSEVINLETETEFKNRHKHIFKLNNGNVDPNAAEDIAEGYIDENGIYHGNMCFNHLKKMEDMRNCQRKAFSSL